MGQLFISYRHSQIETVRELETRLKAAGISAVRDETKILTFDSISATIHTLLADSHALLVVLSDDYHRSRFCQWELTAAFIAAQRHGGDPRRRIFVLNLSGNANLLETLPLELKDAKSSLDPDNAVAALREKMADLDGTFGQLGLHALSPCYGRMLTGSPRFVGREQDMWRTHSALQGSKTPMVTGHVGPDIAEVSGMGGIGKTLLAEEYALRFSAAYPGGIFWLDAYGSFNPEKPDMEAFRASCVEQYMKVARAFHLTPPPDAAIETLQALLRQAIENNGQRCLWIVDDIPTGLAKHLNEVKQWLSPHPSMAPTLATTRSREYADLGTEIPLDLLAPEAALELLKNHQIDIAGQSAAAEILIERLGRHALALDIAGATIHRAHLVIEKYLAELDEEMEKLIDVPEEIVAALPAGHETSIVTSLFRSIYRLKEPSLDFLRLAANLAPAPIRAEFVAQVFCQADGLEEKTAESLARRALMGCEQYSLARGHKGSWAVHALTAATIQYLGEALEKRGRQLKSTAVTLLCAAYAMT